FKNKELLPLLLDLHNNNVTFVFPTSVVGKTGLCPLVRERCRMLDPPNDCDSDGDCPGIQKCCEGFCGRKCVTPVHGIRGPPVKPGYCRYVRVRCAMPNPPIRCRKDSVCDGAKKCCVTACGTACVDPVFGMVPTNSSALYRESMLRVQGTVILGAHLKVRQIWSSPW
uniref:WAP domain-containing protein n=1 Tax=Varanus komodoensis TaxID=61221 RepID=A0A8D2L8A4_VARKO